MNASSPTGADLHLHSSYSDGTFTPREVVAQAACRNVCPIALTDHDTVAGIPEALQAGAEMSVEVIPGVELSAHEDSQEIHILGYFIRWEDTTFQGTLDTLEGTRRDRLQEILRRLHRLGVPLTLTEVFQIAGKGTVGRLHVARALLARGSVRSRQEAFDRFLAQGRPAYVNRMGLTARQAIAVIRQAEGVAVLAHPGRSGLALLTSLIEAGLQGIEVFHPSHDVEDIFTLTRAATEHNLLITGGSDCHGLAQGDVRLGQTQLPLAYVERLRQAATAQNPTRNT
ncbi:MAG: PHP domain-containing protein [candidate division NC10 bacterium]|nr:PHP domain-containing protein [candidate division NC10 bacterium]